MEEIKLYKNLALQKIKVKDTTIGLRQIGSGEDLVLIHGFPTHGYTWRKIVPELSQTFKCHILDLPGLGDSEWTDKTNFSSKSQAEYIIKVLEKLGINRFSLIAHDSGATIARFIALTQADKVDNLIILNTEIPHHRPPWIPFYQKVGLLPTVPLIIRSLLKQQWFIKSPMGFRELYTNKSLLAIESNISPYTHPVISSQDKAIGAMKYVKGIDWKLIDEFENLHRKIKARTLFLWGEQDKTFPIRLGKEMVSQFSTETEFVTIKNASLLPHEEKPDEVVKAILNFMCDKSAN